MLATYHSRHSHVGRKEAQSRASVAPTGERYDCGRSKRAYYRLFRDATINGNTAGRDLLMRTGRDCVINMTLRLFGGPLAAVVLGMLLACGQSEDDFVEARVPAPASFDLLESGFHRSTVWLGRASRGVGGRHDRHICGCRAVDPFGNVLQSLTPRHNAVKRDWQPTIYESRYAFFAATGGEYGAKLENRCLLDDVAASRPCNGRSTRCRNDGSESRR